MVTKYLPVSTLGDAVECKSLTMSWGGVSGGGVRGDCEAAAANGRGEDAIHMNRTDSMWSA